MSGCGRFCYKGLLRLLSNDDFAIVTRHRGGERG
jgi:hypothetical protein